MNASGSEQNLTSPSLSVEFFHQVYAGKPAWEIDEPQPFLVQLERSGCIRGAVLDIGCGTGCNAIYLAERGYTVTGFDLVAKAVQHARDRLGKRPLPVAFYQANVLKLINLGIHDTAIDSGVFHVFNDKDRLIYAANIHKHLWPGSILYLICFSEHQPGSEGPRRVTQEEIKHTFEQGWNVESISESIYRTSPGAFGDARAWLVKIVRL
ncbi:MAG TPA: class I SAM-dependent methyltransferase [Gemmatales bacterium]|nr:class I SAM-dependent methyltransferase [Gemmatales bacterium]